MDNVASQGGIDLIKSNASQEAQAAGRSSEVDFAEIDTNDDNNVSEEEFGAWLESKGFKAGEGAYNTIMAQFFGDGGYAEAYNLFGDATEEGGDGFIQENAGDVKTLDFGQFQQAVEHWSQGTLVAVNTDIEVTGASNEGATANDLQGGNFLAYTDDAGKIQWAVQAENGRYYDVSNTSFSEYQQAGNGIEFSADNEIPADRILKPDTSEASSVAEIKSSDVPPEVAAQFQGDDGQMAEGQWFRVDNGGEEQYVFLEEQSYKNGDGENKGYLDVHVLDAEGNTLTSMTGDPHVTEQGSEGYDWHYTSGSSFTIGNLTIDLNTTDFGAKNTFNTSATLSTTNNDQSLTTVAGDEFSGSTTYETSATSVLSDINSIFGALDQIDVNTISAHSAALLVFLESSSIMDDLVVDVLSDLQERNNDINALRTIRTEADGAYGRVFGGVADDDKEAKEVTGEDAAAFILGDYLSGADQLGQQYTVGKDENGQYVFKDAQSGEIVAEEDLKITINKEQAGNVDKAIDGKIQELTGDVELVMTTVRNFLTKKESFAGATGTINQGLGSMLNRIF